ncbi:MazG nucleotide pyrophosphohydrolase domain-containing protein [Shouchella shacheensis]|uniref:MazG nucleotide pyrophosphohydrolase domain-containing protein n=1 Tax=Shouchella shacheensis TaxID=1649580 RepID=UPI00073FBD8E|nr:MazG nucleotide pyrophosphohydrolase domain-containing protein [Shouchella shacheensis]
MELHDFQKAVSTYYRDRGWSELNSFIRIGFLAEETGEVARAIRAIEIGRDRPDEADKKLDQLNQDLTEELGDVLGNLIIIANRYDISLEDIFQSHIEKLDSRYKP